MADFRPQIVVAGGGLIGLSIALELASRGSAVTVLEKRAAMQQASIAAAGMLAFADPYNPSALRSLAAWSSNLWPNFLKRLTRSSGMDLHFQTESTVQRMADGTDVELAEKSVDPREVANALLLAARGAGVRLAEGRSWSPSVAGRHLALPDGEVLRPDYVVHASGAWFAQVPGVRPCKGQMLRVRLQHPLPQVHRSEQVYVVPRHFGAQAGTALIGATLEDAGFDVTTQAADLQALRERASTLVPQLHDADVTPQLEAWAGLRPRTPDGLPLLGFLSSGREFVATGHFRNGVLLAPATAILVADALEGSAAQLDLSAFAPERFAAESPHMATDIRPTASVRA